MNKSKIEQRNELGHFVFNHFTKLPPFKKVQMYVRGEKSLKMAKSQILDLNSIQLNMSEFEEKKFPPTSISHKATKGLWFYRHISSFLLFFQFYLLHKLCHPVRNYS